MFPAKDKLTICFAHVAYQMQERFAARDTGIASIQVRNRADLDAGIAAADVLVVSGLWRNDLVALAPKLKFIQSIGAGTDQFGRDVLGSGGIRLASASGVNARAVSEHAMSLILAMARRLPEARDNQHKKVWRGMIGDLTQREDELGGKTLIVVGVGRIGGRLAQLAKAFDMHVIAFRANPAAGTNGADEVYGLDQLQAQLPRADFVALTCPLTPETSGLIGPAAFAAMKPSSFLINCARGRCVDEAALAIALADNSIAGAGIDVIYEEPLVQDSPLWGLPNAFITPHTAGETRRYEDNVLDILMENLGRLWRGEAALYNQVV
ncbi:MAG: D-2-hydroxyacid dehydrogenase [Alphaproteobacteria bacterium]|nr:D-2-hydroxyacid dehydrogenase [Alphaproteobacteria bacterium]